MSYQPLIWVIPGHRMYMYYKRLKMREGIGDISNFCNELQSFFNI